MNRFVVRSCTWADAADALRHVRRSVFVVEQRIPESLEWDDADALSLHALAVDASGEPIGCARLLPDGHIGRVAVVHPWRGHGFVTALMRRLIDASMRRGDRIVIVNAQVAAIAFYTQLGFTVAGEPFDEAGIAHRVMHRAAPGDVSSPPGSGDAMILTRGERR
jgi:predicted GNAT family N-acyltransferase